MLNLYNICLIIFIFVLDHASVHEDILMYVLDHSLISIMQCLYNVYNICLYMLMCIIFSYMLNRDHMYHVHVCVWQLIYFTPGMN